MQIDPKFHEDASNLDQLVPFEDCIQLLSTEKSIVKAPEYLLLTHNGRTFKLVFAILFLHWWVEYLHLFEHFFSR